MFLFYFLIIYETWDCFIYSRVSAPRTPHLCLNFIFKIQLNHYNFSFNSVGSASYIYSFILVINWHFYFYCVLGKKSPMMPKENKVTIEFKDFSLYSKKRSIGLLYTKFHNSNSIIKDLRNIGGRNIFFFSLKKFFFHGSRWKINSFRTIIKRVSMRRQLPT